MAKKESTFLNMTLTLFVITALASAALSFVYKYTKDPIEKAAAEKLKSAINVVVPGADKAVVEETTLPAADGSGDLIFYKVSVNNEVLGTAVKTFSNNGFSGLITVMVGFDSDGKIIDSNILEHKETPGLGDKTSKSSSLWNEQFKTKNPAEFKLMVKKDGGDVDAITAATISSRAYCDALQRAYDTFMKQTAVTQTADTASDTANNVEPNQEGVK